MLRYAERSLALMGGGVTEGERMFTATEVAKQLRVRADTVRRWIRQGQLQAIRLGPRAGYRVSSTELRRFMTTHRTERPDEDA
jgi:excisionase family DNA binding protein